MVPLSSLAILTVLPGAASFTGAVDTAVEMRRYANPQADEDNATGLPLTARLSLTSDLGAGGGFDATQITMLGFGRLQTIADGDAFADNNADLTLLFVRSQRGPLQLRAGRHLIPFAGGGARMKALDGISGRYFSSNGTEIGAYAGIEPYRRLRYEPDRLRVGGLLQQHGRAWSLGARVDQRLGNAVHTDAGIMASLRLQQLEIFGFGDYAIQHGKIREARLAMRYLEDNWHVLFDIQHAAPDLFVAADSIFWVFGGEARTAPGAEISWNPSPYWQLQARSRLWMFSGTDSEGGHLLGLDVRTFRERSRRSQIGMSFERLSDRQDDRHRARLFTQLQLLTDLSCGVEAMLEHRDRQDDGIDSPWSARALAHGTYNLYDSIQVAATLAVQTTPHERSAMWGQLHLRYGFGFGGGASAATTPANNDNIQKAK